MPKKIIKKMINKTLLKTFLFWEKLGFHITPNHFYQPIPDTRKLQNNLWLKNSELVGVDLNVKKQLELLSSFVLNYKVEYDIFPKNQTDIPHQYYSCNDFFGSVDGEILYSMIRHFKPKKVFEIGSGFSTYASAQAILRNKSENDDCAGELIAFEPYPNDVLKAGFPGLSKLVPKEIQAINISKFSDLKENDILFIDSSHVLNIGSDVQYEFLEILPRLNKGVLIHIHDVFLPSEYPKEWVLDNFIFWNEQYLLQAFLEFNDSFEVIWSANYMNITYPEKLEQSFDSYERGKTRPASFWIRKIK